MPDYTACATILPFWGIFSPSRTSPRRRAWRCWARASTSSSSPRQELPIGETIRINNVNFRVIGLMEEKGRLRLQRPGRRCWCRLSAACSPLAGRMARSASTRFCAQVISEDRQDAAIAEMGLALRQSRGITFRDEDDFTILSQAEVIGAKMDHRRADHFPGRHRRHFAAGGRYRHHEHHAGVGDRAHAGSGCTGGEGQAGRHLA